MSARRQIGSGWARWSFLELLRTDLWFALAILLVMAAVAAGQVPFAEPAKRVSFTASGANVQSGIRSVRVSDDGQIIVFTTDAQNMGVGTPAPGRLDLYARDSGTGALEVVGIGIATQANTTDSVHMSADARYVLFHASAENIPGLSGVPQVFLRDRVTGALELITRSASGGAANGQSSAAHGISADGRYLLFSTDASDLAGGGQLGYTLYRKDRLTGQIEHVIVDSTLNPRAATFAAATLSANGRFIAFGSFTSDLVPGDNNNLPDQFLRDMEAPSVTMLSVATGGQPLAGSSQRPAAISDDGRFAILTTSARSFDPRISPTATGPIFAVRDRVLGTTRSVALTPFGQPAANNATGILVTPGFLSSSRRALYMTTIPLLDPSPVAPRRTEVYLTDVDDGSTYRVAWGTQGFANAESHTPSASPNGRHIAFLSSASNLDPSRPAPTPLVDEVFIVSIRPFASAEAVGVGTPGTGGFTPLLLGAPGTGTQPVRVIAAGFLGGAPMFLVAGSPALPPTVVQSTNVFVDLQAPLVLTALANPGLPGVPGTGSFFAEIPTSLLNNQTTTLQVFVLDSGAPGGIAATNGLDLRGS